MARASLLLSSCVVLFGVSAACGARTGLPTGALACTGVPVGQIRQVPNLYFILDRSRSMTEGKPEKWSTIRNDIADLMTTLGKDAEFGAAWFPPSPDVDIVAECAPGKEIMPLRLGDGLSASKAGSTANSFLTLTNVPPYGGTPTAATFSALTPELAEIEKRAKFPGHTFAILATDGGPNCNPTLECSASSCTLNIDSRKPCTPDGTDCCTGENNINCLDGSRTVGAVAALAGREVPTTPTA